MTSEIQVMDLVYAYSVSILNSLIKNNYISLNTEEHTNYILRIDTLSHDSLNVISRYNLSTSYTSVQELNACLSYVKR
jgi:hypothetical protein